MEERKGRGGGEGAGRGESGRREKEERKREDGNFGKNKKIINMKRIKNDFGEAYCQQLTTLTSQYMQELNRKPINQEKLIQVFNNYLKIIKFIRKEFMNE